MEGFESIQRTTDLVFGEMFAVVGAGRSRNVEERLLESWSVLGCDCKAKFDRLVYWCSAETGEALRGVAAARVHETGPYCRRSSGKREERTPDKSGADHGIGLISR